MTVPTAGLYNGADSRALAVQDQPDLAGAEQAELSACTAVMAALNGLRPGGSCRRSRSSNSSGVPHDPTSPYWLIVSSATTGVRGGLQPDYRRILNCLRVGRLLTNIDLGQSRVKLHWLSCLSAISQRAMRREMADRRVTSLEQ
jgi:hypothetical protein